MYKVYAGTTLIDNALTVVKSIDHFKNRLLEKQNIVLLQNGIVYFKMSNTNDKPFGYRSSPTKSLQLAIALFSKITTNRYGTTTTTTSYGST
jgi:hypothetical protein